MYDSELSREERFFGICQIRTPHATHINMAADEEKNTGKGSWLDEGIDEFALSFIGATVRFGGLHLIVGLRRLWPASFSGLFRGRRLGYLRRDAGVAALSLLARPILGVGFGFSGSLIDWWI